MLSRRPHHQVGDVRQLGGGRGGLPQPLEDGGEGGVGDRAGVELNGGQRWGADHAHGTRVDTHHREVARTAQPRPMDAVEDEAGDLVALGADGGDPVAHPSGDHVGGVVQGDLVDSHGWQVARPRGPRHAFEPVVAQRPPAVNPGVREGDSTMAALDEVLDSHLADRKMRVVECGQRPDLDVRDAGLGHRLAGGRAQREQAGDRDRVQVLDRIDDMMIVVGLENLDLKQTLAGQRRGHAAARLHRHLAHGHVRHHVEHHTAFAAREVAGGEVGPITEEFGGAVDGVAGFGGDPPALRVVQHVADRGGRHAGQPGHVRGGRTRRLIAAQLPSPSGPGHAPWWHARPTGTAGCRVVEPHHVDY